MIQYTTLFVNTLDKDRYEHFPKQLFIRSSIVSNKIKEKFGILDKGKYKRGHPFFDSLNINKKSIGQVIHECCVQTYVWKDSLYEEINLYID